ncbi:hypothetical protein Aab01nite_09660 [Paractinoplanes abujensis]|nr:hypothetical protein Aab01nite_09660 [Actinoplanes abujensis]
MLHAGRAGMRDAARGPGRDARRCTGRAKMRDAARRPERARIIVHNDDAMLGAGRAGMRDAARGSAECAMLRHTLGCPMLNEGAGCCARIGQRNATPQWETDRIARCCAG